MLIMGVAPILAPLAGSLVLSVAGWRWIFAVLALFGALLLLWVHVSMEESLPAAEVKPLRWGSMFSSYADTHGDGRFTSYALRLALVHAGMFAYITGARFVLLSLYRAAAEHLGSTVGLIRLARIAAAH